jgi:hypothetical protein
LAPKVPSTLSDAQARIFPSPPLKSGRAGKKVLPNLKKLNFKFPRDDNSYIDIFVLKIYMKKKHARQIPQSDISIN